jgi:uncharacterized membrane protein
MRTLLLITDAIVDLALGFFLVLFPVKVLDFLGLPVEAPPFYAIILGGVLIGIGIALFLGLKTGSRSGDGLGLHGAMLINLFGALALASLLIKSWIYIPLRGYLILLGLLFFVVLLCGAELLVCRSEQSQSLRKTDE